MESSLLTVILSTNPETTHFALFSPVIISGNSNYSSAPFTSFSNLIQNLSRVSVVTLSPKNDIDCESYLSIFDSMLFILLSMNSFYLLVPQISI